jgi:hypothetical protein
MLPVPLVPPGVAGSSSPQAASVEAATAEAVKARNCFRFRVREDMSVFLFQWPGSSKSDHI